MIEADSRLRTVSAAIAVALPIVFLGAGMVRAYPFVDDVYVPAKTPDDWHTYKQLALSVVREGLSMPALATTYAGIPHGFLYIYFLILPLLLIPAVRLFFANPSDVTHVRH